MVPVESFSERLKTTVKACIVVTVLFLGVAYTYDAYHVRQLNSERDGVGLDASVTANLMWSAYQKCVLVGAPNLVACESQPAQLIDDQVAAALAKAANSMRRDYDAKCEKHYDKQYCSGLLNRAFHIAQARPAQ